MLHLETHSIDSQESTWFQKGVHCPTRASGALRFHHWGLPFFSLRECSIMVMYGNELGMVLGAALAAFWALHLSHYRTGRPQPSPTPCWAMKKTGVSVEL